MISTKYSRVLGISNMDFTPADITATGVLPYLLGRKIYPSLPGKHEKNYINSSNQIRKGSWDLFLVSDQKKVHSYDQEWVSGGCVFLTSYDHK
jgi:hypothetical protein